MADEKDHDKNPPRFTTRVTNFRKRTGKHEKDQPCAPKLPPAPGPLPMAGEIDPDHVLNRKH
jgi:hypothetical protein